jgi:hypothetical protein
MLVAVSGGTGFIGRPLVDRLLAGGHRVRLLTRSPGSVAPREGVQPVAFDASAGTAPDLSGCEAVIHLAGEAIERRWTESHKRALSESRVNGTRAVVEAARRSGTVRTLISASGVGYYGACGDEELDERSPAGNDFLARLCEAWEAAAVPAREAGLRLVIVRIGIVLHPEGGALKKMLPPFRLGLGGPVGSGRQWMSWVHRDDQVSLLLHALEKTQVEGVLNGSAPRPVTNAELARALGRALNRPAVMRAPAVALRLAFGEMATMVLDGQKVLPRRALESGFTFAYPELEGALAEMLGRKEAEA